MHKEMLVAGTVALPWERADSSPERVAYCYGRHRSKRWDNLALQILPAFDLPERSPSLGQKG